MSVSHKYEDGMLDVFVWVGFYFELSSCLILFISSSVVP